MDDAAACIDGLGSVSLRRPGLAADGFDHHREGGLHVRGLLGLVLGPLPMEAQDGDAPLVLHGRIEFAEGVFVRNHLAAAGEADAGAILLTDLFLVALAVARAGPAGAQAGHPSSGAELDVVAAGKAELAGILIQPPRDIDVGPRAFFIMHGKILEGRHAATEARAYGVHDIFADEAGAVGESVREAVGLRVEQDAGGLARAGGEDDRPTLHGALLAGDLVDVDDAVGLAVGSDGDLAGMGVAKDIEVAGRERRRKVHGGRLVVGLDRAAATAVGRPETRRALLHGLGDDLLRLRIIRVQAGREVHVVLSGGEDRAMDRDHGDAELGDVLLDVEFTGSRLGRREQCAVRRVRRILEAFVRTVDADEHLDLIVIRGDVFVAERPVKTEAIPGIGLEVVRSVAERDTSPVVGTSAEHAGAPPVETLLGVGRSLGIRLAGDFPTTIDRRVVEAERLLARAHAEQGRVGLGLEHRGLGDRVVIATGLEHEDLHAVHGERVGGLTAARAGTDDDHVIVGLQVFFGDDSHGEKEVITWKRGTARLRRRSRRRGWRPGRQHQGRP